MKIVELFSRCNLNITNVVDKCWLLIDVLNFLYFNIDCNFQENKKMLINSYSLIYATCQSKTIYSQCKLVYFTMSLCRPSLLDKLQQSNEEVKAYLTQKQGEFFFFTSNTQRAVSV